MMVIKIGGGIGTEISPLLHDLPEDEEYILVHGGSDEMNRISIDLRSQPRFIESPSGHVSRFTDEGTLDILKMVYSGKVNKTIVEGMRILGINAIGLTGLDGGLLVGKKKGSVRSVENGRVKILRGDNTGRVDKINTDLLKLLLSNGYVPVITIPISSVDGRALNADADRVAASIATAMKAQDLLLLTNQPGLLRDISDQDSLVKRVSMDSIEDCMDVAEGRMKKKVLAAREALEGGVNRIVIADANSVSPVSMAMKGKGTVFS